MAKGRFPLAMTSHSCPTSINSKIDLYLIELSNDDEVAHNANLCDMDLKVFLCCLTKMTVEGAMKLADIRQEKVRQGICHDMGLRQIMFLFQEDVKDVLEKVGMERVLLVL